MSGDRQANVKLTGDASGLNAAADSSAKHIDGVGAAADRAQKALSSTSAAAAAYSGASRQIGQSSAAQAAAMTSAGKAGELSAKQVAMAYRQLPMQLQDVAVSLAGGMNPLMVLAQQGGQITQSFGGVGNTIRALGSAITPTVAVVAGLAAVVGTLATAYTAGQREATAYTQAVVMTGNAAGVTNGQLDLMAKRVAASVGTQGQAAAALAAATASGRVTANNLGLVAESAVRMQRTMGTSVEETTKLFAELAKKPAEASKALNGQYNYLDAATYKRIASLEKQKRFEEAAALAQKTAAEATIKRTTELESRLGTLEKGWLGLGDAAKKAWNFMLGVGREDTDEERLVKLQKRLAEIKLPGGASVEPWFDKILPTWAPRLGDGRTSDQRAAEQLRLANEAGQLEAKIAGDREAAAAQAKAAAANRKSIAEAEESAKHDDAMRKARYQAELQAIDQATKAKTDALAQQQRLVDAQLSAGSITEAEAYRQRRELIQQEARAEVEGLQKRNAALAAQQVKYEERIARDAEIAKHRSEAGRIQAKAGAEIAVLNAQEAASLRNLALATKQYKDELDALLASRQRQADSDIAGYGMGDQARDRASRRSAIDDKFQDDLRKLNAERESKKLPDAEYNERLAALQRYYGAATSLEDTYQARRAQMQSRGDLGFQRAWENWADKARDVYGQVESAGTKAFDGIASTIANAAVTGKADFGDLAKSVMVDIVNIYVKAQLLKVFEGIFGGTGGAGGFFASAAKWLGGMFGGGSSSTKVNGIAGDAYVPASVGHGGGVIGREALHSIRMSRASDFNGAPRLHTGLATDEFRAILKRGESVLTPGQMRQLAPAGASAAQQLQVTLVNQSGAELKATETRQSSDGGIVVVLQAAEQFMADRVGAGTGPLAGALRGRYGLRDALA